MWPVVVIAAAAVDEEIIVQPACFYCAWSDRGRLRRDEARVDCDEDRFDLVRCLHEWFVCLFVCLFGFAFLLRLVRVFSLPSFDILFVLLCPPSSSSFTNECKKKKRIEGKVL